MTEIALALQGAATAAAEAGGHGTALGEHLPLWSVIPFVGMLLSIAVLPLTAHHWFEQNKNRAIVAAIWGVPMVAYLIGAHRAHGAVAELEHVAIEYVQFIVLLFALFTIAGGIYVTGNLVGTTTTVVVIYAVGAILANLVGTTGAAMIMIRPLLRAVAERKHKQHIVIFFIFVVCNSAGLLTPLADPPLFLGFLRGIDFFWYLTHLWPEWLVMEGLIFAFFVATDRYYWKKEGVETLKAEVEEYVPFGIAGKINFLYLLGVIGAVLASEPLLEWGERIHFIFLREAVMLVMVALSLYAAPSGPRAANSFQWGPIEEVAILFAGIFATMVAPLALLKSANLAFEAPWLYFWSTGLLSSFLDNAPTFLVFMTAAQGVHDVGWLMTDAGHLLAAVSCGAVFMGANSYVGNAPNFMVKSIAETEGIKMPSFFGYMLVAAMYLLPLYFLHTLVFFR